MKQLLILQFSVFLLHAQPVVAQFSLECKIKMTSDYISSSCGLTNGIRFDELQITKSDNSGFPTKYEKVISFKCYNPGVKGTQTFWPKTIYFNKPNGHYVWKIGKDDGFTINSKTTTKTCPTKFKRDTWYFLNFFDQRYEAFLYVDKAMKFHVHKRKLSTNF
jgi:hypothetical protein